jgi:hypothetical protein
VQTLCQAVEKRWVRRSCPEPRQETQAESVDGRLAGRQSRPQGPACTPAMHEALQRSRRPVPASCQASKWRRRNLLRNRQATSNLRRGPD